MAFFDAVWLASSFSSLEKVFACHQGLTVQPKHACRLLQPALSKGHQGNAFKRALRDAQRNIDKISTQGLKAVYNGIIGAISKGNEEMVDKAIDVAVQESAILRRTNRPHWEGESLHGWGHVSICQWSRLRGIPVCAVKFAAYMKMSATCTYTDLWGMGEGIFQNDCWHHAGKAPMALKRRGKQWFFWYSKAYGGAMKREIMIHLQDQILRVFLYFSIRKPSISVIIKAI